MCVKELLNSCCTLFSVLHLEALPPNVSNDVQKVVASLLRASEKIMSVGSPRGQPLESQYKKSLESTLATPSYVLYPGAFITNSWHTIIHHSHQLIAHFGSLRVRNAEIFEQLQANVRKDSVHVNRLDASVHIVVTYFRQMGDKDVSKVVIWRFMFRACVLSWLMGTLIVPRCEEYDRLPPSLRVKIFTELCAEGLKLKPGEEILRYLTKRQKVAARLSNGLTRFMKFGFIQHDFVG